MGRYLLRDPAVGEVIKTETYFRGLGWEEVYCVEHPPDRFHEQAFVVTVNILSLDLFPGGNNLASRIRATECLISVTLGTFHHG
jgi:hypothetical protein